jgi:hypothetical protein
MPTPVMNLVIQTERSSIYYPTEKPVIVTTTVDVNVDISIDPMTEEIIITITNANSLDPSTIPVITDPDITTDSLFWIHDDTIYQLTGIVLQNILYSGGSHIDIVNGAINLDTTSSVNFVAIPTAPTPNPGDNSTNVATTAYVDNAISAVVSGLDIKDAVNLLASSNITISDPGAITIDGVSPTVGWRLGLIGQTSAAENGIYIWNGPTSPLTRSTDADTSELVNTGMFFFVSQGTQWENTGWILNTPPPITLGTTALNFTQFTGTGDIQVTTGLTKSGNVIGVDFTVVAPLISPAFTGTPTAPTQSTTDNSIKISTTAFVVNYVAAQGFAPLLSPSFTGTPTAPTASSGSNTSQIANAAFVNNATDGVSTVASSGGTVTLIPTQYGTPILLLTGALVSNATYVVPNNGWWVVSNRTTGAFTATVRTNTGSGVLIDQGYTAIVIADGTNVVFAQNDFNSITLLGNCIAVTQALSDNSNRLATTAFVQAQLALYLPLTGGEITGSLVVDNTFAAVSTSVLFTSSSATINLPQFVFNGTDTSMAFNASGFNLFWQGSQITSNSSGILLHADNGGGTGGTLYLPTGTVGNTGSTYLNYLTAQLTLFSDHAEISVPLDMNYNNIINVLDPVNPQDAATKNYVDSVVQGLDVKESVRLLALSNINISNPGAITIDSVSPNNGDRIGLIGETDATTNGIYIWNGSSNPLTRSPDANTSAEVNSGMFFWVTSGTANADSGWILTTPDPIVLGTTALSFTQFSGAAQITAGTGLTKTGNVIAVNFALVAALASPAFSGVPLAPTAATNTNTQQLATTAYVISQIAASSIGYSQLPAELSNSIVTMFFATLSNGQLVYIPITQVSNFAANFANSIGYCGTLPSGSAVFNIGYLRSGTLTAIGTLTFTSASNTGTFSSSSLVNLHVGDLLVITQPNPADALLANVSIALVLTKQ